jgi:hypothetical protein
MSNPVFETALATILQALEDIESEVGRLKELEVRAQGAQQRLDALQVQERELKATVSGLAASVTAAQQHIEDASRRAGAIVEEGNRSKAQIINDGIRDAAKISAEAQKSAQSIVDQAKADAATHVTLVANAKRDLASVTAQQNAILQHIESAQAEFKRIKQSAAEFAGE